MNKICLIELRVITALSPTDPYSNPILHSGCIILDYIVIYISILQLKNIKIIKEEIVKLDSVFKSLSLAHSTIEQSESTDVVS